jgi:hypothetical protein
VLTVWSDLARDTAGIVLFVVWLAMPPIYLIALGRVYLRRYEILYQQLRDYGCECDCCRVPEQAAKERIT